LAKRSAAMLIVQPELYGWWVSSDGLFESILNCPDKEELNWQPVDRALNNPRNKGSELLQITNGKPQ
jgi:putative SOS response-associated peptidase YedK